MSCFTLLAWWGKDTSTPAQSQVVLSSGPRACGSGDVAPELKFASESDKSGVVHITNPSWASCREEGENPPAIFSTLATDSRALVSHPAHAHYWLFTSHKSCDCESSWEESQEMIRLHNILTGKLSTSQLAAKELFLQNGRGSKEHYHYSNPLFYQHQIGGAFSKGPPFWHIWIANVQKKMFGKCYMNIPTVILAAYFRALDLREFITVQTIQHRGINFTV